jgi:hypothetical protein
MKKTLLFVFVLIAASGGSLLFAGGIFGGPKSGKRVVAEGAEVAEVKDINYPVRMNPNIKRASGSVYAWPAEALKPEDERLPPPVYAIWGVKGEEINEDELWQVVDIIVLLPEKESFARGFLEGEDVSDWIKNLPDGLEARAHGIKKGAKSIKIYISGTPTVAMREKIKVTIPGANLTSGTNQEFESPTEQESYDSWKKTQTE